MTAEGEFEMRWEWEKLLEAKDAEIAELRTRLGRAEAALREIADASRMSFEQLGTDTEGNCTLVDCRCSNHIAWAAIRAAKDRT